MLGSEKPNRYLICHSTRSIFFSSVMPAPGNLSSKSARIVVLDPARSTMNFAQRTRETYTRRFCGFHGCKIVTAPRQPAAHLLETVEARLKLPVRAHVAQSEVAL